MSPRILRWKTSRFGHRWIFGLRRGEWWIGARLNFLMQGIEINLFGITLMIGKG